MPDPIRAVALIGDHNADVPSAQKRLQAASLKEVGDEFITLVKQIGNSREGSLAITKLQEALYWGVAHILASPERDG